MPDSLFSSRPEGTGRKNGGKSLCSPPQAAQADLLVIGNRVYSRPALPTSIYSACVLASLRPAGLAELGRIIHEPAAFSTAAHPEGVAAPVRSTSRVCPNRPHPVSPGGARARWRVRQAGLHPVAHFDTWFFAIGNCPARAEEPECDCWLSRLERGGARRAARPRRRGDQRPTESLWAAVTDHVLGDS